MKRDSIELSSTTVNGLNSLNRGDFNRVETPEKMAFIVLILKKLPDTEDTFPRGKWATIQEIKRQLDECADTYLEVKL